MKKTDFAYAKTKAQISCAVIAHLISGFVFATRIVQSHSSFTYNQNFKILAFTCGCIGRFVSDLVRNPEDSFSRVTAHISLHTYMYSSSSADSGRALVRHLKDIH